jgi:S-DNA-T family DNA segregation ATPase FtsK/SpoIIIE
VDRISLCAGKLKKRGTDRPVSQIVVKRPPRALPPDVPTDELQLTAPPELSRPEQGGLLTQFLPLLGMGGSMVYFFNSGAGPFMRVMGWMMLASALATIAAQVVRFRRGTEGRTAGARRDYLRYLAHTRRGVRRTARTQLEVLLYLHPVPDQLWAMVAEGSRVWERRLGDEDFGQVRVGVGPQQLSTPLAAPTTATVDELEPLAAGAMQRFLMLHGAVDGLPVAVSLRRFYHLTVAGHAETAQSTARALVGQLVTFHSPEDLAVAVLAGGPEAVARWDWTKWLPHAQVPGALDGAGTRRLFCRDADELERLLSGDGLGGPLSERPRFSPDGPPVLDARHVVIILDGGTVSSDALLASPDGIQGVTVIEVVPGELDEPRGSLSIDVRPGRLVLQSAAGLVYEGEPDTLPPEAAEALARQLAPLRVGAGDQDEPLLAELDFTDLLDLGDAASVDVTRTWRPRTTAERLRVPIGVGEDGEPVMLDLKEAAQGGMGPHGLCVGATGSGKSELLRTLVLALAVTHSSEHLNLVLADFKGGATFTGMAELPHVSAVITNLADDLTLVDRMEDSIRGELQRRQELLRGAGNYANVHDYERARAAGAPLEPLPTLLLIIDEFSELLSAKPDFIEMFIQIGRIGRSLGVHLLLSSQRLEEGRLRGLDTYLSYRIGLRTFSATESRAALGVADAYHLPTLPGSGYLKFGTDEMARFKAAYVSGAYRTYDPAVDGDGAPRPDRRPALFTAKPVPASYTSPGPSLGTVPPDGALAEGALADTVLDVIVRQLEGQGPAAHEVWQPPLDASPALDELLPPLATSPARGLHPPDYARPGELVVPVGLVDKPFEQRREVLYRDFSDAAGNLLVVGGPQSGKSTLLRTLIASFALTHTAHEAQFYGLDFGGGGLSAVAGLPHVGTVASRLDPERVRRTVAEVSGVLTNREELFPTHGIDSITTYRKQRAAGELPGEPWGDVFLIIDGWGTFKQEHEALEGLVMDLATRGLGYGVHLILTATRSLEVRAALKDQFMNRLELRLGDPLDSDFNRRTAANVPVGAPGRGQTAEGLHFLAAQPRLGATEGTEDTAPTATAAPAAATSALVRAVSAHWPGPPAPEVRVLPRELPADQLPKPLDHPHLGLPIGIDEDSLAPVFIDFDTAPFFLIFGESESGKTSLLRLLARQISERYTPDEARIIVGDYRRALLEAVPESHLLEYAPAAPALETHMDALSALMEHRAPGPDVTPRQLRARDWWSGPRFFVLIDDYELVATGAGNPLDHLLSALPFARDVGVHLIIARSTAGASRTSYEPFMQRVKELGAQGVILSGDPGEGDLLSGIRPHRLPPGRATLITRRGSTPLIQLGWLPQ